MKKSLLMLSAGISLLSLASCSNDDMPAANKDGGVTFTLRIPEEALTRVDPVASGAGTMAKNIHYAVYKHGDTTKTPLIVDDACTLPNVYQGPDAVYNGIKDITLTLQLADNVNYDIVFYATSSSPAYVYDYTTQEISLGSNLKANQESYDAFYAAVSDFTTKTNGGNISVTLTRPFAQLNIGTNDLSNPTVPKVNSSSVTITKVPASLNLLTGQASEVTDVTAPVVFGPAVLPSEYKFPVDGYSNLAMVYVLAGGNESNSPSTLSTVTLNTTPEEGKYSMSWDNVPLRTNYRTNIFGSLFTSQTNFNIKIEPIFGEPSLEPAITVEASGLKKAIESASSGTIIAVGAGNITQELLGLNRDLVNGKDITIIGASTSSYSKPQRTRSAEDGTYFDFSEISRIDEGRIAKLNGLGNVTFKNIKVKSLVENYNGFHSAASITYDNCTIENTLTGYTTEKYNGCTFNYPSQYAYWTYGSSNVTFKGCTFNSNETAKGRAILGYSAGATSVDITVEKCTFNSVASSGDKCAIEIHTELGLKGSLTVSNCTVKGNGWLNENGGLWREVNNYKGTNGEPTYNFNVFIDGEHVQTPVATGSEG